MQRRIALLAVLAAASFLMPAAGAGARPPAASFSAHVDNPWFPLKPGTRYVYTGVKDGQPSRDVVTVTHRTTTIDGAPCAVLRIASTCGAGSKSARSTGTTGRPRQRLVLRRADGRARPARSRQEHGGDVALRCRRCAAGIFMPAHPRVGETGRQEYYKGHAEDHFKVLALFGTPSPRPEALLVQETTPLEPGTVDHKLYVRGIGAVLEQTERGGDERNELVAVTHDG